MKSAAKAQEKELTGDIGRQALIDDLDAVFSRAIRLSHADEFGIVECYTCGERHHWKQMDCGHFIPRDNMSTRYSELTCAPQCIKCNQYKDGNEAAFAAHLEADRQGVVEMLRELGRQRMDYSRDELKVMFGDYSKKVKVLLKNIYQ